jgi:hypothetical protein
VRGLVVLKQSEPMREFMKQKGWVFWSPEEEHSSNRANEPCDAKSVGDTVRQERRRVCQPLKSYFDEPRQIARETEEEYIAQPKPVVQPDRSDVQVVPETNVIGKQPTA